MGFLHRHHDGGAIRYRMREKLFAIGEDFWIETERGDRAYEVDGEALRIRRDAYGDVAITPTSRPGPTTGQTAGSERS